ncbi:cytochrome P450 3A40-like isoform X2 [Gouania willdenowi]|uniref:cytochrome P450 3A40-like isoform X2 n=1 Tax=Gouania willdenowi TaxID=441366 RepID=UPI001054E658|nr:cytochrome P450 3A40-like isoform X2 [Gouania willdenowi]
MSFLPFFSLETWILLISFLFLFVMYGTWTFGVFEKLGIPCSKPLMYWGTTGRDHQVYYLADAVCAQKYGKIWGMYELRKPILAVMDPDMIKTILVKECFTYFTNRRMFVLMKHHSARLTENLQTKAEQDEVICIKDYFGAYSLDVMASCALSVDLDSFKDPSGPFSTHAGKLFQFSVLLFLFQGFFPFFIPLLNLLGASLFNKSASAFFKTVVENMRAERNNSSKHSRDVFQYMINTQTASHYKKDSQNSGLTDHEIISQATMFVFAGYETSSATLCFLVYCLARNPKIMKCLQKEIDATFPNKDPVTYEALMQMEYLDSVVNEGLRLYPPLARLERMAKETVKINGTTIPKGMLVMVPVYALHRDSDLWPEPEEFKPERFSKENKQSINPYTYLPFGIGPRNCLGMRFAMALVKLALVEVLQTYSFEVCQETEIPLQMDPQGLVKPLRPIKLKVAKRCTEAANLGNFD